MKIAYLDAFSGLSGDMCLGALLDCGLKMEDLIAGLKLLPVEGYEVTAHRVKYNGISATSVEIRVEEEQPHRNLGDIEKIISASALPTEVKERSLTVFRCLAEAEAAVHATDVNSIHFHEVGALDAILDIVGTVYGLYLLKIEEVWCSYLPLGRGFVNCCHGLLPLPAPATVEILKGVPVYGVELEAELVTPTGAAIARSLSAGWGPLPPLIIESVGYGAGKKQLPHPNLLRVIVGTKQQCTQKPCSPYLKAYPNRHYHHPEHNQEQV